MIVYLLEGLCKVDLSTGFDPRPATRLNKILNVNLALDVLRKSDKYRSIHPEGTSYT